jgi:glycosyltransferase involved in cell wall biosynthesis
VKLKLLWVTTAQKSSFGHSELYGLSESLIKKGHEVTVLGASKEKAETQGHVVFLRNPFKKLTTFKVKLALYLPWYIISKRPDFIMVEWQSAFVLIIPLLFIKLGLCRNNLIHDVRTIPVNDYDPRREKIFRICLNISKKHFLGITTITRELKRKMCAEYDIPSHKIGIWSSGVDLNLFYARDGCRMRRKYGMNEKFVVFYHGSIGHRRGIVEVVEAFSRLKYNEDEIHLFIVGSGMELEKVRRIKERKELDNVHIHAPVAYEEVPEYISMADVCIVPLEDRECWRVSSPLKVMEYLAMGKPIICTDIIAHREIIKNKNDAFFISDINPETLCSVIEKAYSMRSELDRMSKASLRNAQEDCSWDIQAERFIEYVEKVRAQEEVEIGEGQQGHEVQ